jgi:hypothetical protein
MAVNHIAVGASLAVDVTSLHLESHLRVLLDEYLSPDMWSLRTHLPSNSPHDVAVPCATPAYVHHSSSSHRYISHCL